MEDMEHLNYSRLDLNELLDRLLAPFSNVKTDFYQIWNKIIKKTNLDVNYDDVIDKISNLVVYDILDGSRSTLISKPKTDCSLETVMYALNLIHTLKTLGAKKCYIMIHTSYNRERGKKEFNQILKKIVIGAPLIKQYAIQNDVRCLYIGMGKNYELISLLNDVAESTKNGNFHAYFLIDYNEKWILNRDGQKLLNTIPEIDVFIRHTKFQISGGWIPSKMSRSVFLYSQNGSIYSNWDHDEFITLIALSLLAKLLHEGEILNKTYFDKEEIDYRNRLREMELFNKRIELRRNPKKLIMIGSPEGIYQFYY